jgi:hypothetical protein
VIKRYHLFGFKTALPLSGIKNARIAKREVRFGFAGS